MVMMMIMVVERGRGGGGGGVWGGSQVGCSVRRAIFEQGRRAHHKGAHGQGRESGHHAAASPGIVLFFVRGAGSQGKKRRFLRVRAPSSFFE